MLVPALTTAVAAVYLFAMLFALAPRKSGYSHLRHTISELGEKGAPHERLVAFGVFLPVGLAMLAVTAFVLSASAPVVALAACIGAGYLGAAFFPCDPGSPLSGSARQGVHNLAGAVEYIGGGLALMTIAKTHGEPFRIAGMIVLATALGLSLIPAGPGRGIVQRVAEPCLFGALALAAWRAAAT